MSRVTLCVSLCCALFASNSFGAEPNDDFLSATVLPPGVLFVSDSLDAMLSGPDTILGFFADNTFTAPAIAADDDSGPLGNGIGSLLSDLPVNADGSIPLAVTGFDDFDFNNLHSESGKYELLVDVSDAAGALITSFSTHETLASGGIDTFAFADASWIGGTFTAAVDNSMQIGPDPMDFWAFNGLAPGQLFEAEIVTGDFDTALALLDSAGVILDMNDDGGIGQLSKLGGVVPADGRIYLAVSGYPDAKFTGNHGETGNYTLTVTVPELSGTLLLAAGLFIVPLLARRP